MRLKKDHGKRGRLKFQKLLVGRAILPAAGFQPAQSRLKGGCGQDCPPHPAGHSNRKLTSTDAITGTGLPSFIPGLNRHFETASMAF
jgi:hypothetical protein